MHLKFSRDTIHHVPVNTNSNGRWKRANYKVLALLKIRLLSGYV